MCSREQLIPKNLPGASRKYEKGNKLGAGDFGTVYRATSTESGRECALKIVPRSPETSDSEHREAAVMKSLDHPAIVRLFEVIEEKSNIHYVIEICEGGDLLAAISQASLQRVPEPVAAPLVKQLLMAVHFIHERHVSHNDLNAKNVFLMKKGSLESNLAKVGDFGSSTFIDPTAGVYRSDVFSLGLLMRGILCNSSTLIIKKGEAKSSSSPKAKAKKKKAAEVLPTTSTKFNPADWANVSSEARDLCKRLLRRVPEQRWSALEGLGHPWLSKHSGKEQQVKIPADLLPKLKRFASCSRLQKAVLQAIADQLGYCSQFLALDVDADGLITASDLSKSFQQASEAAKSSGSKAPAVPSEKELSDVIESLDPDGLGAIEFSLFAGAMLCPPKANKHIAQKILPLSKLDSPVTAEMIKAAFRVFDRDGDGKVSCKDAQQVLAGSTLGQVKQYFAAHKSSGEAFLNFDDFVAMLQVLTEFAEKAEKDANAGEAGYVMTRTFLAKSSALDKKKVLRTTLTDELGAGVLGEELSSTLNGTTLGSSMGSSLGSGFGSEASLESGADREHSGASDMSGTSTGSPSPQKRKKGKRLTVGSKDSRDSSGHASVGSRKSSASAESPLPSGELVSILAKPKRTRMRSMKKVTFREETPAQQQTPDKKLPPSPEKTARPTQQPRQNSQDKQAPSGRPRQRLTAFVKPTALAEAATEASVASVEEDAEDCEPGEEIPGGLVTAGLPCPAAVAILPATSVHLDKVREQYVFQASVVHVVPGGNDPEPPCQWGICV